ncbi:MAG TPA: hypothetical protein VIA06_15005 [Candidatus Dormibacteraeota bacterium]|nr:hypothetical protein [Candidatus Dormibacteraeota bacterium]
MTGNEEVWPRPHGAPTTASRDFLAAARLSLSQVKRLTAQVGLAYVELDENPAGVGIAVEFGQQCVILSIIAGGSEGQLYITTGVLRDVKRDRTAILDLCNDMVRDNPAYPIYLHDDEAGWDVILGNAFPVRALAASPDFFQDLVQALPEVATAARNRFVEVGLGGEPFGSDRRDLSRLLAESIL